jgi:hypothetical protein
MNREGERSAARQALQALPGAERAKFATAIAMQLKGAQSCTRSW